MSNRRRGVAWLCELAGGHGYNGAVWRISGSHKTSNQQEKNHRHLTTSDRSGYLGTGATGNPSVRSSLLPRSHRVTQGHHAALVGFDLCKMERNVSIELLEEGNTIANQNGQD